MSSYSNKIILTGATGFIGSHLLEKLRKNNYEVLLVDDNSAGKYSNIKHLYKADELPEVINVDKLRYHPKIPTVIHLGTPSSFINYERNPYLYSYTIKDFLTVLNYCKQWNSKLIYASTGSIYFGNSVPFVETMNIHPKDLYSECHFQMERLCNLYTLYGVKSLGLRLFNVYGNREEESKGENASIISRFTRAISGNKSITIYGDGTQTRDFVHVNDVTDAMMNALNVKFDNDIVNIGSGESYAFNDMVELINTLLDRQVKINYKPNPIGNYVDHSLADISKAKKLLKFSPTVGIEEGVKNIIEENLYKELFQE